MRIAGRSASRLTVTALAIAVCAASTGCNASFMGGLQCDLTAPRSADLAIGDATQVTVRARAGSLRIEGRPGLTSVRASGTACAGTADDLDRVELTATRSGSAILIEVHTADTRGRLDLLLEVPDTLPLEIDDSSGSVEISDVAAVDLRNGSGGIDIAGVDGDVQVWDGSGGIDVSGVGRDVIVEEDGSGPIDITAVGRDVIVKEDGSGGIDITAVGGDVIIEEDGSGGIDVADVGGDFIVRDDGSGGVRHNGVAGWVDVGSD